jgi:hypothetical protein
LLAGTVVSAAVGVGVAHAVPSVPSDIMPVSEIKPGMKGYGLTVFSGTEPERFDVEVISTLRNFQPNQDLILIKTPHPRLNVARAVKGMSGSPIFLNNKMIGAYAYGWNFGVEAIAGVTPIQSMLSELARPLPKRIAPKNVAGLLPSSGAAPEPEPPRPTHTYLGPADGYDLARHAQQIAARNARALAPPEGTSLARASTPVFLGGMGPLSLRIASDLLSPMGLEPLQTGGGSSTNPAPGTPTKFVNGGSIGVELVRGDISAVGTGTVTRVSGDKLLAFGHPMLNGGIVNLPTAIGRVHWIMATQSFSYKLGEAARSLGALVNDRQAAIVVDTQARAPTFPMNVTIEGVDGAPHPSWKLEVAHDQFMSTSFAAVAIGRAFETTTGERRDMTWRATSRVKLGRYGTLTLSDFGAGNGDPPGPDDFARTRLVRAIGALLNNPWEPVDVERVDVSLRVTFNRQVMALRGAKALESEIDAGAPARIRLDLQPYQGAIETRTIDVPVPVELAGREVEIELAPGYEVERPQATPDSVAELFAVLQNQTFPPESIVASLRIRENGAAFRGKVASRLPPGAFDTLRPSSDSDAPETFVAEMRTAVPLQRFLVGRDTVRVKVRPVLR